MQSKRRLRKKRRRGDAPFCARPRALEGIGWSPRGILTPCYRRIFQDCKATAPRIRIAIAPPMQAYSDLFDVKLGLGLLGVGKATCALYTGRGFFRPNDIAM